MKIKAKWGFVGDAAKLKVDNPKVKAGQSFDVDDEYGHTLVGKGLAEQVHVREEPKANKQAAPKENK